MTIQRHVAVIDPKSADSIAGFIKLLNDGWEISSATGTADYIVYVLLKGSFN